MSAGAVRDAALAWFAPPNVAHLNALYRAEPIFASGKDWQLDTGVGFGAMGYLHISDEQEIRIGEGGEFGGIKAIRYNVALVTLYRYVVANNNPDDGPDAWVDGLDALLENIKVRARADRTWGTGSTGVIWQAGEGDEGASDDIRVTRDLPKRSSSKVESWQVVEFTVISNIAQT